MMDFTFRPGKMEWKNFPGSRHYIGKSCLSSKLALYRQVVAIQQNFVCIGDLLTFMKLHYIRRGCIVKVELY